MLPLKPRFGATTRALVVDGHSQTRNLLASHLRILGLGEVVPCARAAEALREVAEAGFDLILCEYLLADGSMCQELIERLRRSGTLSLRTLVIVVAERASYDMVAELAESAVDGFVIRPYSQGGLEDQLKSAHLRKKGLSPIFDAIESGHDAAALDLCVQMIERRSALWTSAARLGAELALRLNRTRQAAELFDSVLAVRAVPWAKLGLSRPLSSPGDMALSGASPSTIDKLFSSNPQFADSYEVLGKLHADEGNLSAALAAYKQASQVTPSSVQRAQRLGVLAFYAGDPAAAQEALDRAAALGERSAHFDPQTLLLLALLNFRRSDGAALQGCRLRAEQLLTAASVQAASHQDLQRTKRIAGSICALDDALQGRLTDAATQVTALAEGIGAPAFEIESATHLLTLLAALHGAAQPVHDSEQWVRRLGLRFCVGRQATDLLAQACQDHAPFVATVRRAHGEIGDMAQRALSQALAGDPQLAVQRLLDNAEATQNTKLLQSAAATLRRYREHIVLSAELQVRWDALQAHCGLETAQHLPAATTTIVKALPPRHRNTEFDPA